MKVHIDTVTLEISQVDWMQIEEMKSTEWEDEYQPGYESLTRQDDWQHAAGEKRRQQ